jgi:hypothetical protein
MNVIVTSLGAASIKEVRRQCAVFNVVRLSEPHFRDTEVAPH